MQIPRRYLVAWLLVWGLEGTQEDQGCVGGVEACAWTHGSGNNV